MQLDKEKLISEAEKFLNDFEHNNRMYLADSCYLPLQQIIDERGRILEIQLHVVVKVNNKLEPMDDKTLDIEDYLHVKATCPFCGVELNDSNRSEWSVFLPPGDIMADQCLACEIEHGAKEGGKVEDKD